MAVGTNFDVNGVGFHYGGDNIYWMGLLRMSTSQAEAESEAGRPLQPGRRAAGSASGGRPPGRA